MARLTPVLLGLDLNAYSVALSFYETFGVKSHAFGRYSCGITRYSEIVETHVVPDVLGPSGVAALLSFSSAHKGETLFLVPCGDWYLRLVSEYREVLSHAYRMLIPDKGVIQKVSDKAEFYALAKKYGIPHPKTVILSDVKDAVHFFADPTVKFPSVLKASDSTAYFAKPHIGQRKVDFPRTPAEAEGVLKRIYGSGYRGKVIWQTYIPASSAETLTVYADKTHRVRCAVRAKVLLEEQAPKARGNYAALMTLPLDDLCQKLIAFTEKIGYVGIGNFDILRSEMGDCVLEMNPRQGRSCDYLRAAGISVSGLLVGGDVGTYQPSRFHYPEVLWRCVGKNTLSKLCAESDKDIIKRLEDRGKVFSPFEKTKDNSPLHSFYVRLHLLRRGKAVREYAGEKL